MYWYDHGMNGWGYAIMVFTALAFWALVALATVALLRRPQHGTPGPGPSAEQVLAERFARGEIDEDEYRRRLAVLHDRTPPPMSG